jgi:hypothetical protein
LLNNRSNYFFWPLELLVTVVWYPVRILTAVVVPILFKD